MAPGELGLVRANVTGEIEMHGDPRGTPHSLLAHGPIPWRSVLLGTRRARLTRERLPV